MITKAMFEDLSTTSLVDYPLHNLSKKEIITYRYVLGQRLKEINKLHSRVVNSDIRAAEKIKELSE